MTALTLPQQVLSAPIDVRVATTTAGWDDFVHRHGYPGLPARPAWQRVFQAAFRHQPWNLEARERSELVGVLPLSLVESRLFGRFLVSLPYLNSGGVLAESESAATKLIDEAVRLADRLDVKHLELRHERLFEHPAFNAVLTSKVHLRLPLPATTEELWSGFKSKLRSQIKKPLANTDLTADWGRHDLLSEFYDVFCANMRDLGTPPYSRKLFASILDEFPKEAEFCVVRHRNEAVSAALLIHADGVTQVPSASTLRTANPLAANMLMYWRLLERAVERGQQTFDFGRSTRDAGTYSFKKQWGAEDHPAHWQYYVRKGTAGDLRPDSPRYARMIALWKKLPITLTRWIGPTIVRGIP